MKLFIAFALDLEPGTTLGEVMSTVNRAVRVFETACEPIGHCHGARVKLLSEKKPKKQAKKK